jgi:hypothetical protein
MSAMDAPSWTGDNLETQIQRIHDPEAGRRFAGLFALCDDRQMLYTPN